MSRTRERAFIGADATLTAIAGMVGVWSLAAGHIPQAVVCFLSAALTGFTTFVVIEDTRL